MTLKLGEGRFKLSEPLRFSTSCRHDSARIHLQGLGSATVFDGGVEITGWTNSGTPGILQAPLPAELKGTPLQQLWVGGERRLLARWVGEKGRERVD